jgi:DNA repair protein RecO (recombination protein O)
MEWKDEGLVIARRHHGESAAIVSLLTREHGRHLGLVRGGTGRRAAGLYEPGNLVRAVWRGRLQEHLGSYACEPVQSFAARVIDDALRLGALTSACAIVEMALPEREPHEALYAATLDLFEHLEGADWLAHYARWECQCLADLGFGLDLSHCALTGTADDLAYVSPRSGRAVSRAAGQPYADKLFRLPSFLAAPPTEAVPATAVLGALDMTGYFLERTVLAASDKPIPPARIQFIDRLRRSVTIARA